MKKIQSRVKQQCKLCQEPVTNKTGLQCRGACQRWMHFKCLNFTPGKIQDIKKGIIQVNCPCPTCNTTVPKEILVGVPLNCEDKTCPAAIPPICDQAQCPSRFISQDINAPAPPITPKPITTIRGCDAAPPCDRALSDLPPEPPPVKETCGQKCPPAFTPSKPKPDSTCKPKAKEKPKQEPLKCKCSQAVKLDFKEKAAPCPGSLTDLPETPPVKRPCCRDNSPPVCPPASEKKNPAPPSPPCMKPVKKPPGLLTDLPETPPVQRTCCKDKSPPVCPPASEKKSAPPSPPCVKPVKKPALPSPLCSNTDCAYGPAPATPPALPKTSSSYPSCGPSFIRQDDCTCCCDENLKKTKSDGKIPSRDSNNEEHILVNVLQNLCGVMGELSKQVDHLVGKLVNIIDQR